MSCIQPITLVDRIVPCGKCESCKLRRVNGWVLRLIAEQKVSQTSHFVTLTYEDEKNTSASDLARITKSGLRTLVKSDIQNYIKRLRKAHSGSGRSGIKYYLCGEYGTKSRRPHYHLILFGAQEVHIRSAWHDGFVHIGTVTQASVAYCLKYISKHRKVPEYLGDDRQAEFSLMSKRLGTNYLTDAVKRWHAADPINRCCSVQAGGDLLPLPRYLKEIVFTPNQRKEIAEYYQQLFLDEIQLEDHAEWQKSKEAKRQAIAGSYRRMEFHAKDKIKI